MNEQRDSMSLAEIEERNQGSKNPKRRIAKSKEKGPPLETLIAVRKIQQLQSEVAKRDARIKELEITPMPDLPHDSAYVHSQLKNRHTELVFPTLDTKEKDNKQLIVVTLIVLFSVFAAWGVAYEAQVAITPHVPGQCSSPAVIQSGGCFITQTSTDANGNTHTTLIPAGKLKP